MGLHRAGFEVVGFDIEPQSRYPFEFHLEDALTVDLSGFDAVWASPPCQDASVASNVHKNNGKEYPNLVTPSLVMLKSAGLPFIVENVPRRDLGHQIVLCGLSFGLPIFRHRQFASDTMLFGVPHASHIGKRIGEGYYSIAGGAGRWKNWGGVHRNVSKGTRAEWREAMGIDWMTRHELTQAVPPAYSEYLGKQLLRAILA